jgi:hypothetical protein
LLNINATLFRICFTVSPSWATIFCSARIASFQAPLAVAVAATAPRTPLMCAVARAAVSVRPATVNIAFAR